MSRVLRASELWGCHEGAQLPRGRRLVARSTLASRLLPASAKQHCTNMDRVALRGMLGREGGAWTFPGTSACVMHPSSSIYKASAGGEKPSP